MSTTNHSDGVSAAPGTVPAVTHWYGQGRRLFYGLLWLVWALLGVIGGFSLLGSGATGSGLLGLAFGGAAAIYDYRIWTWQARRLWVLIIF